MAKNQKNRSKAEIVDGFNFLRNEQRQIASKIYELENDLGEHKIVIDNLKLVEEGRKCYRMIGGVLVEKTVKSVLPDLHSNSEQIKSFIETLNGKLIEKGKEILEYKEKNNIQFQFPNETQPSPTMPPPNINRIVEEEEPAENPDSLD